MAIAKAGRTLTSLTEWQEHAGPKASYQWADDRSAKEAARAWLEGGGVSMPPEVIAALSAHPAFGSVDRWDAEPEAKLRFDSFRGETRNSDLAVFAHDATGPYLIAVEAKADETFGDTVEQTLLQALDRKDANPQSKGIARLEQLASALIGLRREKAPALGDLRYQLLTACAGALCEAERRGCSRAVLLVHEFITSKTKDDNHAQNALDLERFVRRISAGAVIDIEAGRLCGPFFLPGAPLVKAKVALFVGKVIRNLRTGSV